MMANLPVNRYSNEALKVMARLSEKHQVQLEFLRANHLPQWAISGRAAILSNYPGMEYKIPIPFDTMSVLVKYYLSSYGHQAFIFSITMLPERGLSQS